MRSPLPCGWRHVTERVLRLVNVIQRFPRAAELQIRECASKTSNAVIRIGLQRGIKVIDGILRILHVIADVTTNDQCLQHFGIFLNYAGKVVNGLLQELVLAMHVSGQQGENSVP